MSFSYADGMAIRTALKAQHLQERVDALEEMLHEERKLTQRNAMVAIIFENALGEIARLHPAEHAHPVIAQNALDRVRKGDF